MLATPFVVARKLPEGAVSFATSVMAAKPSAGPGGDVVASRQPALTGW